MKLGMGVINFRNHPMYVIFNILGSKLHHIPRDFKRLQNLATTAGAHYSIFISTWGPTKSLHERVRKARVVRKGVFVGGWMGWDQKGPSIFLIFMYINKQSILILTMAFKVVYSFYLTIYELF